MPPFSVGDFCAANPVELCELLAPHLDAYDLGALARVARTFRAWPAQSRRRCKLRPRAKFTFKGHLGAKPVMVAYREIKMDLFVCERYTNTFGNHWTRAVWPAKQVDLEGSLVDVELVCARTQQVVERLLQDTLFAKKRQRSNKQKDEQCYQWRTLRFKIDETLSSNHPAPGQFYFCTTARVARKAGEGYGTYVHNSPPFHVVSPWAMPKEGSNAALAREQDPSRHGWRGRYV